MLDDNNTENYMYISNKLYGINELFYRINRAGSGQVNPDFYIERNSSYPYCVIHYAIEGSGEVVCRGKKYQVKKGQCFILNSFEAHSYSTNSDDTLRLGWIEFYGGDSAKLIGAFLSDNLPVIAGKQSRIIGKYISKILVYLKNDAENSEFAVSRTIYAVMLQLLTECKSHDCSHPASSKTEDIRKVLEYIDSNLGQELSVEQLARVINYNPQYFSRLFQKHMGMPPARYIMRKRISAAKILLSTEDIKIDILASQLGFSNASHFIRKFKKAEGITPAQFRKESLLYYNEESLTFAPLRI